MKRVRRNSKSPLSPTSTGVIAAHSKPLCLAEALVANAMGNSAGKAKAGVPPPGPITEPRAQGASQCCAIPGRFCCVSPMSRSVFGKQVRCCLDMNGCAADHLLCNRWRLWFHPWSRCCTIDGQCPLKGCSRTSCFPTNSTVLLQ